MLRHLFSPWHGQDQSPWYLDLFGLNYERDIPVRKEYKSATRFIIKNGIET